MVIKRSSEADNDGRKRIKDEQSNTTAGGFCPGRDTAGGIFPRRNTVSGFCPRRNTVSGFCPRRNNASGFCPRRNTASRDTGGPRLHKDTNFPPSTQRVK